MSFLRTIANFNSVVNEHNSKVFRKIALDLYAEIVKRTPVDTGLARGNWRIGVNSIPQGTIDRKRQGRSGEETSKLTGLKVHEQTTVYIVNNLEYIIFLERGHSKQAPAGMVNVSMNAIMAQLQHGNVFLPFD